MRLKWMGILPMTVIISLFSCHQGRGVEDRMDSDSLQVDSCQEDSLSFVEEEIEDAEEKLDSTFDDFLFAFTHSLKLFYQRVKYPIVLVTEDGTEVEVASRNFHREFSFLNEEYFTILYGDASQIEDDTESTEVYIERISLDAQELRTYNFNKIGGKWMFTSMHDSDMHESELGDFLSFYSVFSSDSLYQTKHIAQHISVSMLDPEDDGAYIDGTIDADQWHSFCPEVPAGTVTNIRRGQSYGGSQVVMEICGTSNGLQELLTFRKDGDEWKLVSYEN